MPSLRNIRLRYVLPIAATMLALFGWLFVAEAQTSKYNNRVQTIAGASVPGATITVCTTSGSQTPCGSPVLTTTADAAGNYVVAPAPGTYDIFVSAVGFATFKYTQTISPDVTITALRPQISDAIQYVSTNGNDSNDGLSQGTAKLTVAAAKTALPSGGHIVLAAGSYTVGSPGLNFTNTNANGGPTYLIEGPSFGGGSASGSATIQINFTGAGTVGLDLSGSNNLTLRNLNVSCGTSTANAPIVCVLNGRTAGANAIQQTFDHVAVIGYSPWIYYNLEGEQFHSIDSSYTELATTGTPFTLSAVNGAGITSPNVTFPTTTGMTVVSVEGSGCVVSSNATAAGSKLVLFDEGATTKIEDVTFRCFANELGTGQVVFADNNAGGTLTQFVFEMSVGSTSATNTTFNILGTAVGWRVVGANTNSSTTTQLAFGTIRNSDVSYFTDQSSGTCFTGTAVNTLVRLDTTCTTSDFITYVPVITASSGTFTSVSATGRYKQTGHQVLLQITVTITTNGTAGGGVLASLPIQAGAYAGASYIGVGRADAVSGKELQLKVSSGGTTVSMVNYDNTYPGASGETLQVTIVYEI